MSGEATRPLKGVNSEEVIRERTQGRGDPEMSRLLTACPSTDDIKTWAYWNLLAADRAEELGLMRLADYHRKWSEWWEYFLKEKEKKGMRKKKKEPPA